jgi:hypothetical protein
MSIPSFGRLSVSLRASVFSTENYMTNQEEGALDHGNSGQLGLEG